MDLRPFNPSPPQLERAHQLVIQGLLGYQPWLFADDFETGVGLEFETDTTTGLVHYPDIDPGLLASPQLRRRILPPDQADQFRRANQRLRLLYEAFVDRLCVVVDDPGGITTLDVGCNTGYLPIAFSRRGVKRATGCDRQDYRASVDLLNEITGENASFVAARYDPQSGTIAGVEPADIVTSLAVLCHLSDPLRHLACLGDLARKALFVWTMVNPDSAMTLHFGEPRGDYPDDRFPFCFDNRVCPSTALLRRSLELLGFRTIIELPGSGDFASYVVRGFPFYGVLGVR